MGKSEGTEIEKAGRRVRLLGDGLELVTLEKQKAI
jgi:hypothetical protein